MYSNNFKRKKVTSVKSYNYKAQATNDSNSSGKGNFSSVTLKKNLLPSPEAYGKGKQKPTLLGARSYSTITYENSLNDTEFYE